MLSPSNILEINGTKVPCPKYGIELIKSVVVDSGRNANGEVVGQQIGRVLWKINNLEWIGLFPSEWNQIESALRRNGFFCKVKFMGDDNKYHTITMYPSDLTISPLFYDEKTGYKRYESCKFNLIDCGKAGED